MKQKQDTFTDDFEDVILWPCGSTCYRYELGEYLHKSDDYAILRVGTPEYIDWHYREDKQVKADIAANKYKGSVAEAYKVEYNDLKRQVNEEYQPEEMHDLRI